MRPISMISLRLLGIRKHTLRTAANPNLYAAENVRTLYINASFVVVHGAKEPAIICIMFHSLQDRSF